jgi:hypothetical protein
MNQQMPPMGPMPQNGQVALPGGMTMSEAEFKEMLDFLETLDEKELQELERIGREALVEMGINPDTLEQVGPAGQPTLPMPTPEAKVTPPIKEPAKPVIASENIEEVKKIIQRLIELLGSLRQKISQDPYETPVQRAFNQDLASLIYYLKLINKSHHYDRLFDAEYALIMQYIKELYEVIASQEPLFTVSPIIDYEYDDPYEILRVTYDAVDADIKHAFEKISEQKSPENIKKRLLEEGLAGKDLQRQVKQAQLNFSIIKDAYEKLSDPKTRAQIDRERQALYARQKKLSHVAQEALNNMMTALSQAFSGQRLNALLEDFLKKYEPQELELKKKMDKAEKDRFAEQQARAKIQPTRTPGTYDAKVRYGQPSTSSGAGYNPFASAAQSPSSTPDAAHPVAADEKKKADADKKGGTTAGKKDKKDDKKEDKDKKDDKEKKDKKAPAHKEGYEKQKTKSAQKSLDDLIKDELKCAEKFVKAVDNDVQLMIGKLPDYMYSIEFKTNVTGKSQGVGDYAHDESLNGKLNDFIKASGLADFAATTKVLAKKIGSEKDQDKLKKYREELNPVINIQDAVNSLEDALKKSTALERDKDGKKEVRNQVKAVVHLGGSFDNPGPLKILMDEVGWLNKGLKKMIAKLPKVEAPQPEAQEEGEQPAIETTEESVASAESLPIEV